MSIDVITKLPKISKGKQQYQKHREKRLKYQKEYKRNHQELVKKWDKIYRERHREQINAYNRKHVKERRQKQKLLVLKHYSKGKVECRCCGEQNYHFLTIDHVDGSGSKHRQQVAVSEFYRWLIKNSFPEGFQVLCMNCNWGRRFYATCPHLLLVKRPRN